MQRACIARCTEDAAWDVTDRWKRSVRFSPLGVISTARRLDGDAPSSELFHNETPPGWARLLSGGSQPDKRVGDRFGSNRDV